MPSKHFPATPKHMHRGSTHIPVRLHQFETPTNRLKRKAELATGADTGWPAGSSCKLQVATGDPSRMVSEPPTCCPRTSSQVKSTHTPGENIPWHRLNHTTATIKPHDARLAPHPPWRPRHQRAQNQDQPKSHHTQTVVKYLGDLAVLTSWGSPLPVTPGYMHESAARLLPRTQLQLQLTVRPSATLPPQKPSFIPASPPGL